LKALPPEVERGLGGVDLILHAGDLVSGDVLDLLELIAPVRAVCGNCEVFPDLRRTPVRRTVKVEKAAIGLIHVLGTGAGLCSRAAAEFGEGVECVVFGHTHRPHNERCPGGTLLFNPGSATQRRSQPARSYGILTVNGAEVRGEIFRF